jgi:hypothetical protein
MNVNRPFVLRIVIASAIASAALSAPLPAHAIPAFARKYGTSCLTCHVVYPKLNPFGEAFRRNGYRFPGVDSDYVKQETVALGQEANKKTFPNSVWPGTIPISVPLSFGANGQAVVIPDSNSTAGRNAQPGTVLTLQDLVAEAHIWAGAALDDTITLWAELTFGSDGSLDVEHAQVLFNDLIGPKHAVNLIVGHGFPNITPFAPHSSYIADQMVTNAPVAGIYGIAGGAATPDNAFTLVNNYTGGELNGVVAEGRLGYALGLNAGVNPGGGVRFPTEDVYAHVAYKLGGMRLDGEGSTGAADPLHPWAENALTLYGFGYHANSFYGAAAPFANDVSTTWGGGVRGQYGSAELNAGFYNQLHNHGVDDGSRVTARVFFSELSYVVFPWMVPALRVESQTLDPELGTSSTAWHVMPGIAFLIRPNLKLLVVANWEHATGFPVKSDGTVLPYAGGSADWGPISIAPSPGAAANASSSEFETIAFFLAWAI